MHEAKSTHPADHGYVSNTHPHTERHQDDTQSRTLSLFELFSFSAVPPFTPLSRLIYFYLAVCYDEPSSISNLSETSSSVGDASECPKPLPTLMHNLSVSFFQPSNHIIFGTDDDILLMLAISCFLMVCCTFFFGWRTSFRSLLSFHYLLLHAFFASKSW